MLKRTMLVLPGVGAWPASFSTRTMLVIAYLVIAMLVSHRASAQEGDPTITGRVFDDRNGNRSRDVGEPGLAGVPIAVNGQVVAVTDGGGGFKIYATSGELALIPNDGWLWDGVPLQIQSSPPSSDVAMPMRRAVGAGIVENVQRLAATGEIVIQIVSVCVVVAGLILVSGSIRSLERTYRRQKSQEAEVMLASELEAHLAKMRKQLDEPDAWRDVVAQLLVDAGLDGEAPTVGEVSVSPSPHITVLLPDGACVFTINPEPFRSWRGRVIPIDASMSVYARAETQALWEHLARRRLGNQRIILPRDAAWYLVETARKQLTAEKEVMVALPALLSVIGDDEAAQEVVAHTLKRYMAEGDRVMILGNRDLWDEITALKLPTDELPMLNPLARGPDESDLYRWLWWGGGLQLPEGILKDAYENEVATLPGLLGYLKARAAQSKIITATTIVQGILKVGVFGEAESDPRAWFEEGNVLAVESHHPALTRFLALAAIEAGARLVLWHAPGIVPPDKPFLQEAGCIVYPDIPWVQDVLVTRCTDVGALTGDLQRAAQGLQMGEMLYWQRGHEHYFRVSRNGTNA